MAVIDNRGRLFGRFNLIDAAVAVIVLALIPIAYGAYLLFRQPQPALSSVTPNTVGPQVTRVRVAGQNLRPFLRVSFNQLQGRTFAFINTETADIDLPELPPGTYDVILYDVAREISRMPGALTVEGSPLSLPAPARMVVSGRFVGLDENAAKDLTTGAKLTAIGGNGGEIIARGEPAPDRWSINFGDHAIESPLTAGLQLPVLIRTTCTLADRRCQVGGREVAVGFPLTFYTSAGRPLRFEVTDAVSDGPTAAVELTVRFVVPSASAGAVKAGDRARRDPLLGDRVPVLQRVGNARPATATVALPTPPDAVGAGDWRMELTDSATIVDAVVRVRADATSAGLYYRGRALRAGAPFLFEHERYALRGWIQALTVLPDTSAHE
jgi:hypothetical protein